MKSTGKLNAVQFCATVLCAVWYCPRVWYAKCGTEIGYGATRRLFLQHERWHDALDSKVPLLPLHLSDYLPAILDSKVRLLPPLLPA
eukprot:2330188-Rhodomonas_salina.1